MFGIGLSTSLYICEMKRGKTVKKRIFVIAAIVFIILIVLITYINTHNTKNKSTSVINTDLSNVEEDSDSQSYWSSTGHSFAKTENGYYFVSDTGQYLMYFDKESKDVIPVCGKADCQHNSSTCNAYLGQGQFLLDTIYYNQGYIYLISYAGGYATLVQVNADGSGRKEVAKLMPSDGGSSIRLVFHGNEVYVYDRGANIGSEDEKSECIIRVSLTSGEQETVYEYKGISATIDSAKSFGNKLFFILYEGNRDKETKQLIIESKGLYSYDYDTGQTSEVTDKNIYDYYFDTQNQILYSFVKGEGLYKTDIESGEENLIYKADSVMSMCNMSYDGTYIYLDNIFYCTGVAVGKKRGENKKCIVLTQDGTVVNTISCKNYLTIYYGDNHYMFADRPGEDLASGLVYIDKNEIETVSDWTLLTEQEIDLLGKYKVSSKKEPTDYSGQLTGTMNTAEFSYITEKNEAYKAEIVSDHREVIEENKIKSMLKKGVDDKGSNADTITINQQVYNCTSFEMGEVFHDENIKSIEYLLENCPGSFMKTTKKFFKEDEAVSIKSEPYISTVEDQKNIWFLVLCPFGKKEELDNSKEVQCMADTMEKARIKVVLTYTDGTTEEKFYGFKQYSQYNYNNFDMYELTLGDE